ncbi:MAG: hypothetical protein ACE5IJ_12600, partial [Thermoplasmata archaeon]
SFANVSMSLSSGNRYYSNRTYDQMGAYFFTIWASDPAGNWNSSSGSFSMVGGPPSAPPTDIQASLQGASFEDVRMTWTLSADDGAGKNDVVAYNIYRGEVFNASGVGYSLHDSVASGTAQYVDPGAGEGNPSNFFYQVCSINTNSSIGCSPDQAGKFTMPLSTGRQLLSIPLIQSDSSVEAAFQTVAFDSVWAYDSLIGEWETHMDFKAYKGDLSSVSHDAAYWVDVTRDCNFTVAGVVPLETQISLQNGWNLVGFPSFNPSYAIADLKTETGASRVEGLDPSATPHCLRVLSDVERIQAGGGYWVKVDSTTIWTIRNS